MSSFTLSRRSVIGAGIGGATLATLGDLPALAQSDVRLRMFWWGAKERAERTDKVNQLYSSRPSGHDDRRRVARLDRLLAAARDADRRSQCRRRAADGLPLHLRIRPPRRAVAARRLSCRQALNLTDFSPAAVDSGKVDGKIYGVSLGLNSTAMVYDKALIQSLGLKEPTWKMTWKRDRRSRRRDHQGRQARRLYRHGGRRRQRAALEVWLAPARQVALHARRASSATTTRTSAEWFAFWSDLRKRGACAAPDTQALDRGEIDSNLLTHRQGRDRVRPLQPAGRLPGDQQEQARPLHLSRTAAPARNPAST